MIYTIRDIQDSGKLLVLDDGSKWEVDSCDALNTRMCMRIDKVEVVPGKVINLSRNNQSISARRKF
jgi:hypothetical protein